MSEKVLGEVEIKTSEDIKIIKKEFETQKDMEAWVIRMWENPNFILGGNSKFAVYQIID